MSNILSDELTNTVTQIGDILKRNDATLSVAESCTGGKISSLITSVSGASKFYKGSVTSYYIEVKERVLGVDSKIIKNYGVVSEETAAAMANGVRNLMQTDYAISTTGLAGNEDEDGIPAGTVCVGISSYKGTFTFTFHATGSRKDKIISFSKSTLETLLKIVTLDLIN